MNKNISWVAIGNIIYALCQWLAIIIIARMGSVGEVGIYSFALAISAPLIMFFGLNLRVAIATDHKNEFTYKEYKIIRYWLVTLAVFIVSVIAIVNQESSIAIMAMILIAISKGIESIIELYLGIMQKNERHSLIAKVVIAKGVLMLIGFLLGYFYFDSFVSSLLIVLLLWGGILFFITTIDINKETNVNRYEQKRYFSLFMLTLPLSFVLLFDSLTINSARYIIESKYGLEQLGYFSSVAYFMVAGSTVIGAIGYVITPHLSKLLIENNLTKFIKLTFYSVMLGILIGISSVFIAFILGDSILILFYGNEYGQFRDVLVIVMLSATFWYGAGLAGCAINAARKFKYQVISNFLSFIVTLILSFILYEQGLIGISWAIVIGMGVRLIMNILFMLIIVYTIRGNVYEPSL